MTALGALIVLVLMLTASASFRDRTSVDASSDAYAVRLAKVKSELCGPSVRSLQRQVRSRHHGPRTPMAIPPLLEREPHLRQLATAMASAEAGEGSLVLVCG